MSYSRTGLKLSLCVVIIWNCVTAVSAQSPDKKAVYPEMRLENLRLRANNVDTFFARLAFSYDIPIGLEVANYEEYDTSIDWDVSPFEPEGIYRMDFKEVTLASLLAQFVAEHNRYDWKIEDGVVNVFPREPHSDYLVRELLRKRIPSFAIKPKTDCWSFINRLFAAPELQSILARNEATHQTTSPGGFYIQQLGQRFTAELTNYDLRSLLNVVIKHSPTAKVWVIDRRDMGRSVSLRINARPEITEENSPQPRFD